MGFQKFSVFIQLFLLPEQWALLLYISVGAEGSILNVVKFSPLRRENYSWLQFRVVYSEGAHPGSSHASNSRFRVATQRPIPKQVLFLLELLCLGASPCHFCSWYLGDLQTRGCFQERWVTPVWKCYCHWRIQKAAELSWSKLVTLLLSTTRHMLSRSPTISQGKTQQQETLLAECYKSTKWLYKCNS